MKFLKFLVIFLVLSSTVSCITNKDLVYIQDKGTKTEGIQINEIDSKPYRVQVNDLISIKIKALDPKLVEIFSTTNSGGGGQTEQELYFTGYSVDSHGNIRVPVLGEINVLGFSVEEIRNLIEKRLLAEYFTEDARIYVTVNLAGFRYVINGEIGSPGITYIFQDKVTILEAIANSGDIALTGNRKDVEIIRKNPNGYEIIHVDLTDRALLTSPKLYLQPNDYVYVKPLKQKSWGTGTTVIQTVGAVVSALSLITTSILLFRNI